jgi:TRAP-type C4-dicarboxylate transport system substrate-binding protein
MEQFAAVQKGVVDIAMLPSAGYARQMPEVNALNLTQCAPWELRERGFYDYLVKRHKEFGVFYLGWPVVFSPWYTYTNFPVKTLNDFKGKTIIKTTDQGIDFIKALGAEVVRPVISEIYTALERGVAAGLQYPVSAADLKVQEVLKYVIDHPFYQRNSLVWLVNLNTWNRLEKHQQGLLIDVVKDMERDAEARDLGRAEGYLQIFKKAGLQFIKLPAEDAKRYLALPYETEWAKLKTRMGEDVYLKVRQMVTK